MLLGEVLRDLQCEATATQALAEMNDVTLLVRVRNEADRFGETPAEYVVNSVRGFANHADDQDWLAMTTAIETSEHAGRTCLSRMIDWALRRDAASRAPQACACGGRSQFSAVQ